MFSQNQTNTNAETALQHPIPPPTHETQYRAIGLVWGTYQPQDKLTRGRMKVSEQASVETVLLGRAISVVKKHINLEEPHLWVVYPRTRQKQDYLHLQIVGVWEPTTLHESSQRAEQLQAETVSQVNSQAGYFSVRGELIFYSEAQQKIIIKIKRGTPQKPTFFKLKLNGTLPDETEKLGWFWDLDAQLKGEELVVTKAQKIAPLTRKNKPNHAPKKQPSTSQPKENFSQGNKKPKPIPRRTKSRSQGKKKTGSN
ncbi:MAG: hypothetical protein ABEI32_00890 [Halothece sp.]